MDPDVIRQSVRQEYGKIASSKNNPGCGCGPAGCCGPGGSILEQIPGKIGYSELELASVPEGANLGLGCGNPRAIAALKPGETVLDLGSGAGFDCFLAAREVSPHGRVIGVDMTPEMVSKARENARKPEALPYSNVEFRLGEIENLPVADASVDVIISNCVINLSAEKEKVFKEAYRVLRPGGRLAISDIVAVEAVPEAVRHDLAAIAACVGGAEHVDSIRLMLDRIGFENIAVKPLEESRQGINQLFPDLNAGSYVLSATIQAIKPAR